MKRKLKLFFGIILLSVIGFLGYIIVNKLNHKKEVQERIKTMPNFFFYTLNGEVFSRKNMPEKPSIFVYFNSDCDYCQLEAIKIEERLYDFGNVQLIFVSFEGKDVIQKFAKNYKLDNKKNVLFLEDSKGEFSKIFDVNSIPYTVVYGANGKLLKKFKGITKVDKILQVLN
jgi:peroxiredoxin